MKKAPRLAGAVAIVAVDAPDLARRLAGEGATVVLAGGGEQAGRLVAELEAGPGRVAVFHGEVSDVDALAEFVAEEFNAPRS